jgi:hypothetical protein
MKVVILWMGFSSKIYNLIFFGISRVKYFPLRTDLNRSSLDIKQTGKPFIPQIKLSL